MSKSKKVNKQEVKKVKENKEEKKMKNNKIEKIEGAGKAHIIPENVTNDKGIVHLKEEQKESDHTKILQQNNRILSQRLEEQILVTGKLRNDLYRTEFEVLTLNRECEKWKSIAQNSNKNPKEIEENWNLIETTIKNIRYCCIEVIRMDKDLCRIKVKATPFVLEVTIQVALKIIQEMFGADTKTIELQDTITEEEKRILEEYREFKEEQKEGLAEMQESLAEYKRLREERKEGMAEMNTTLKK